MESTKQPPLKGLSQFLVEHEKCGEGFDISHPDGLGSGRVSMRCRGCGVTYDYATATIEFEREVEFEPVVVAGSAAASAAAQDTPSLSPPTPAEIEATMAQAAAEGAKDTAAQPDRITQEIEAVPLMPKAPPPPPPPVAIGPPKATAKGPRKPPRVRQGTYWTRDRKIVAGLLGFAVLALAFAAIRLLGGEEEPTSPTSLSPPPAVSGGSDDGQSSASQPAAKKSGSSKSPAANQEQPGGKQGTGGTAKQQAPASEPAPRGEVEKVVETERFSLIVPNVWEERQAAGGFVLAPPGDAPVSVQVYYENDPGMSLQTMVSQTRDFLRSRDIETRLQPVERLQVDGVPAFKIRAVGPAGTQIALGVLDNPYRYLVIESLDPGVPSPAEEEANRAIDTFLPR